MKRNIVWLGFPSVVSRVEEMLWEEGNVAETHRLLINPSWIHWMIHPSRSRMWGLFQSVRARLDRLARESPDGWATLRHTTVVVLLPDWIPLPWNPSQDRSSGVSLLPTYEENRPHFYPPTLAWVYLMLAYPEVHWVFLAREEKNLPLSHLIREFHVSPILSYPEGGIWGNLKKRLSDHPVPLFDGTGLRLHIRDAICTRDHYAIHPFRDDLALVIDEEPAYALFESYVAYRFGFRAFPILTESMMRKLLRTGSPVEEDLENHLKNHPKKHPKLLLVEDLYLDFPDRMTRRGEGNFSNLTKRDAHREFFLLGKVASGEIQGVTRAFVTVGHRHVDRKTIQENRTYIREMRERGVRVLWVHKPLSGMHTLAEQLGLGSMRRLQTSHDGDRECEKKDASGHSSPGVLMYIAKILTQRTEEILQNEAGRSVENALHGALLAMEAEELLMGRTPTMTLRALALRHELEVLAESQFHGVEAHLDVDRRVAEMDREVRRVVQWFHPRREEETYRNTMIQILNRIRQRFEEANLLDEAQRTLHYIREQERRLWSIQYARGTRRIPAIPLAFLVRFLWKYINQLMASPTRFLGYSIFWILLFSGVYYLFPLCFWSSSPTHPIMQRCTSEYPAVARLLLALRESVHTFISFSPRSEDTHPVALALSTVESLVGFLHFGVLVSYLYRLMARD